MLSDKQWAVLEPLIEACRPKGKTPPQDLRRHAVRDPVAAPERGQVARHPADLGPWSRAAQTFIRWAALGVWERLLTLARSAACNSG
jgi:transposase